MEQFEFIVTIISIIGASIITAISTVKLQKTKFKKEFEHDVDGIRTNKNAEDVARKLLDWEKFPKRKFSTIKHFLKGFENDELRKILIGAGAVSFDGKKDEHGNREELWGLIKNNEKDIFPDNEKNDQ